MIYGGVSGQKHSKIRIECSLKARGGNVVKIAIFVLNIFQNGRIERAVSVICNQLAKTGKYNIAIISIFKTAETPIIDIDERIVIHNLFKEPFSISSNFFVIANALENMVIGLRPSVFINAGMFYVPLSFRATMDIKTISWEHFNMLVGKKDGNTWFGRRLASKSSNCIVVSTKRDMENYLNSMERINRIEQIYNPCDFSSGNTAYNPDTKRIISHGSFIHQKGFDMLVKVAEKVLAEHPDWSWDIYGNKNGRKSIEGIIEENGLSEQLMIKERTTAVHELYKDYSLFVMTSRFEESGMDIVEAQINKLPVVSFNCDCGPGELIAEDVNGHLIECFDIDAMAEKIGDLIENREKRIKFSGKADLYKSKLDVEVIASRWEQLIDSL